MLTTGDTLRVPSGAGDVIVGDLIGQGGQGEVYAASIAGDINAYAVKWYWPDMATTEQWDALAALIDRPDRDSRFLWPLALVTSPKEPAGFGYLMPLRDPAYIGIAQIVGDDIPVDLRTLALIGMRLADTFLWLHSHGLCYRDINYGNIFAHPPTGQVLICDVDNIGITGASSSQVIGTVPFMAPEVIRGEMLPSTTTDLHSLAVLLYKLLLREHPLEGARTLEHQPYDRAAQMHVLGHSPTFVFDPHDSSNGPVPELNDSASFLWRFYPTFLRDLFTISFTDGLVDPRTRTSESMWRKALARLPSLFLSCPSCGAPACFDEAEAPNPCATCAEPITPAVYLKLRRQTVMAYPNATLAAHHVLGDYDFDTAMGTVELHPSRPEVVGLRNLSHETWTAGLDGSTATVEPGQVAPLIPGVRINFGGQHAEVIGALT